MSFEDYKTKDAVTIVYTGEGKGKTSASLGLMARALGSGWRVAYVQFIKHWQVGEHDFIEAIMPAYKDKLVLVKGGKGFYNAGDMSAAEVSEDEHKQAAADTYDFALQAVQSGDFQLVICDEINNAVSDGLISKEQLETLIDLKNPAVSLCLTGRDFPKSLINKVDIATNMTKLKHHFDDKYLANEGIDY